MLGRGNTNKRGKMGTIWVGAIRAALGLPQSQSFASLRSFESQVIIFSHRSWPSLIEVMVRNYVRKTNRGSWTLEQITNAVSAVIDEGKSCYSAAKMFGIPQSTLDMKVRLARGLYVSKPARKSKRISKKKNTIPQKKNQLESIRIIKQSDDDEDTNVSEECCLELPNDTSVKTEDPIAINVLMPANDDEVKDSDYDSIIKLYMRILAKKLVQVRENDKLEIMCALERLILNKLQSYNHEIPTQNLKNKT